MAIRSRSLPSARTLADRLWRVNWLLLVVMGVVVSIAVASLYSIADGSFEPWAERHAMRFLLGVALVLVVAVVPVRLFMAVALPVYLAALALLALVLVAGVEALGARRWLAFGGLSFQPSELMKVAIIVVLARYYEWLGPERVSRPLWVLVPLLLTAAPAVLVLKQPDLGTAGLIALSGLGVMFLAGVSLLYFVGGALSLAALAPFIYERLHGYQKRRLATFLDPERDPLGAGYHITQSKIALGSGGLSGKGFMQGTQSQLDFLPEHHTDFIFAMFGEEMGFVGGLFLIGLFAVMLSLIAVMAMRCRAPFNRLTIGGTGITLFLCVVINVGMVTGLVPVVGVPLPLVSYGGTAMTTVMLAVGIAMCCYVNRSERLSRSGPQVG